MHHTLQSITGIALALFLVAFCSANHDRFQAAPIASISNSSPVVALVESSPLTAAPAGLSNSTVRLQNAVSRLNTWLSDSEAEGWRRFLLLNILETQSALGERADISTLAMLKSRFLQNNPGLAHPAFNDVRLALDQQIKVLGESRAVDLMTAAAFARSQYQPISVEAIGHQRDLAKYELEVLKRYYRKTLSSRERAKLFVDLELDEAIEFLEGLQFTLAPEVSVGKMDSMIRDVQKRLDSIVEKIDAMPLIPQPKTPKPNTPQEAIDPAKSLQDDGPAPDNKQKSLAELQREQEVIQKQMDSLKEQRAEILKQDKPRRDERNRVFRRLRELENNFVQASETQTDPYFVSTSMMFEQFVRTYFYGTEDNLQEDYLLKLADLEKNLLLIEGPESREISGIVGDALRWFDNANQASSLVVAVRARYSLPNLYVSVSGKMLSELAGQTVTQSQAIRENVGGRLVRGNGLVQSKVQIDLQDDPNQVHASVHLRGTLDASTYIEQGKLQVYTGAAGQLEARRSIYANLGGLFAANPQVAANVHAYLNGTSSRIRLINRIVKKKFDEVRTDSEGTTASKTEQQLRDQFLEQTNEAVSSGQEALAKAQDQLAANANVAPQLYLRSTNSQIVLTGKKSSISTLAAQGHPQPSIIPTDIGVRVHESMFSNFLKRKFSGKTFTDEELAKEIGDIAGGEPAALTGADEQDGEDKSFSITFATIRPIQFEFENNGFGVSVSGTRFSQGGKRINTGLRIGLRFKIVNVNGELKFVRDGRAELDYVGKKDAQAVAFRSFLDGRLNPKEGVEQMTTDLPPNLLPLDQFEGLADSEVADRLRLVQCRAENGWLYLGWNHQPANAVFSWAVDLPAVWTDAMIKEQGKTEVEPSSTLDASPKGVILDGPGIQEIPSAIQPATTVEGELKK